MTECVADTILVNQTRRTNDETRSPADPRHGETAGSFAEVVLPHLDAAYNLARWLVRNETDAEDVVQDAYVRALRYFGNFRGGDARAWVLMIVRNTCYRWLRKNRKPVTAFDEELHGVTVDASTPETILFQHADRELVELAMSRLPTRFREILVLRELEGLSYKEIAEATHKPIGTVMSSISRARQRFRQTIIEYASRDTGNRFVTGPVLQIDDASSVA